MIPLFILICSFFGLIFARISHGMKLINVYLLLTSTGLMLFLFGTYIFSISSMQAAIGSIAFTIVFLLMYFNYKKKIDK